MAVSSAGFISISIAKLALRPSFLLCEQSHQAADANPRAMPGL